jgi:putative endonuclease
MPSFVRWTTRKRSPPRPRNPPRNRAERRAAWWYRLHGYRILDTNVWLGGGELDIVARRGRCIVFCEVKSRTSDGFGDALEAVGAVKAARVRRAAESWLARHPEAQALAVRFDVIADRSGRLEHVPDAF